MGKTVIRMRWKNGPMGYLLCKPEDIAQVRKWSWSQ